MAASSSGRSRCLRPTSLPARHSTRRNRLQGGTTAHRVTPAGRVQSPSPHWPATRTSTLASTRPFARHRPCWIAHASISRIPDVVDTDDGIVTKVDDLRVGGLCQWRYDRLLHDVQPGCLGRGELPGNRPSHMHRGQAATIEVDAYPGRVFKAHVASMSPGTGSEFSVLPPENATGNWVKVVQRLPVRLELDETDPNRPLYSGISVTARVDMREATSTVIGAPR